MDETPKIWVNGTPLPELTRGAAPIGHPWEMDELGTDGLTNPAMIYASK